MKSHNSRINCIESSAGGLSCSNYESNRNLTQFGAHVDITNISPMAVGERDSSHLNNGAHMSRFDRSDLLNPSMDKSYIGPLNCSQYGFDQS